MLRCADESDVVKIRKKSERKCGFMVMNKGVGVFFSWSFRGHIEDLHSYTGLKWGF